MRLPPLPGERIDRSAPLSFTFDGKPANGLAGDSIGSALYASGRRVFSRSFKYHRPRGLLCCTGSCPNCLMTVDGVPNVRVCTEPLRAGADVRAQNVRGSLERDLLAVTDKIGGPFTPVGFYYRTMIRPRRLWPVYEHFLRSVAGLGRVDERGGHSRRYDTEHRLVDVLVIGGGSSGRAAAAAAAAEGGSVLLVDERAAAGGDGYDVLAPARALAVYEGGLVPVDAGDILYRIRAGRIVVATGAVEQPLVFPGNDLVGVMLPSAVRRLVDEWAIRPGVAAVVVGADAESLAVTDQLERAGVRVEAVVDLRATSPATLAASGRGGRLGAVTVDGVKHRLRPARRLGCPAARVLAARAGGRARRVRRRAAGSSCRPALPAGVEVVGDAAGELSEAAVPAASYGGGSEKCFVCVCEDVTVKDVKRALAEGFDSIELAKRYTTVTMGPCQGRLCHLGSIRLLARETKTDEAAIGTTTARPPWAPVELGLLAGRHYEPMKRSPLHFRHEEARRADDVDRSLAQAVRLRRPGGRGARGARRPRRDRRLDARQDPDRRARRGRAPRPALPEPLLRSRRRPDPLRRADDGRRPDHRRRHRRPARRGPVLRDDHVDRLRERLRVVRVVERGLGLRRRDRQRHRLARPPSNVAGPQAREALQRLTSDDVSNEALRYLDAKHVRVAGVPCLALRIGFVGELGYELHCAASAGEHLWDAFVAAGAVPFGLEPQRVLRLEKAHVIVGQDTDSESNLLSAGMPWIAKLDKDDFVGKWAVELVAGRGRPRAARRLHPAGRRAAARGRTGRSRTAALPAASRAPARASGSEA